MFPSINPTTTPAWKLLEQHAKEMRIVKMKSLFADDKKRFDKFSFTFNEILIDFSKNIITDKTRELLLQLAMECRLKEAIEAMFAGELINQTENRSVLH